MDNFIYWGSAILVRIIMPSIILNLYFNAPLIPKESKHLQKYFAWFLYMGWQYLSKRWIAYTYTKSEPSCIIESGWLGYTVIIILFRLTAVFRESWRYITHNADYYGIPRIPYNLFIKLLLMFL